MKVSVFGLGYVGCVSAACLAQDGHTVVGVDIDQRKTSALNEGHAPFYEPGLAEILAKAKRDGLLTATTDETYAIAQSDCALVCVGTPSEKTGETKLEYLRGVLTSIGTALRDRTTPFVLILRSTVMPHVVQGELMPLFERAAGRPLDDQLQFCYNPEFLREGTAIRDFYDAAMVVIGHNSEWAASVVAQIYAKVKGPVVYTDIGTAALVKYVCNCFHALKVSFANEVGRLGETLEVDGRKVMQIVCMDTKLNISEKYLAPGFAFGGSCLPKDLRAVSAEARHRGMSLPLFQSISTSNDVHLQSCIETVLEQGERLVGLFGLAFKEGTDDLRESPAVALAEALIGKGLNLAIFEPSISHETIYGTNLSYIERTIPHIWSLMTKQISELLAKKVVVLLRGISPEERAALHHLRPDQICLDFANALGGEKIPAKTLSLGTRASEPAMA